MPTGPGATDERDQLDLSLRDGADGPVLSVKGEVDVYTVPALRDALYRLIDGGASRITVDVAGMDFIDSSGLGVFVGALKRQREQAGELVLRGLQPAARKVFEITGLTQIFEIEGHA
jgi:anti-sigma B factor antagonist